MTTIIFETHSTTEDNEAGIASGWGHTVLSARGRQQARDLGARRRGQVDVIYSSDLARAIETVEIAFAGDATPRQTDSRLRECNYGMLNGGQAAAVHGTRLAHVDVPYLDGESFEDVARRVAAFLAELQREYRNGRALIVGHSATRYALDHLLRGTPLAEVITARGDWQPGWTYNLEAWRGARRGWTA